MKPAYKYNPVEELNAFRSEPSPVEIEENLGKLSWWMDDLFRVPVLGWRFGLDAIAGLIPGFGDTATSLVSFYILASAVRYRVPRITLLRMGLNIGVDYLVGSIPFVGDILDAWWKANRRNVELLRGRAQVSKDEARAGRLSDWIFVSLIMLTLAALAIGATLVSIWILVYLGDSLISALQP